MDNFMLYHHLEEVGDSDIELGSVLGDVAVTGVTVHKTVVIADIETDDVVELDGHPTAKHYVKTAVISVIAVVVYSAIRG